MHALMVRYFDFWLALTVTSTITCLQAKSFPKESQMEHLGIDCFPELVFPLWDLKCSELFFHKLRMLFVHLFYCLLGASNYFYQLVINLCQVPLYMVACKITIIMIIVLPLFPDKAAICSPGYPNLFLVLLFFLIIVFLSQIEAGKAFADYPHLLAPDNKYEVLASMPGYKPKNTTVWLEDEAMSLDFLLDPEEGNSKEIKVKASCDCNCGIQSLELTGFTWRTKTQRYFLLVMVTIFILIFFARRFFFLKHRQSEGSKRPVLV